MFEPKVIGNKDIDYENDIIDISIDRNKIIEVLISVNPVYDWLEENINIVSYKLLKAFITNIVPLGKGGERYFKKIANKKTGFTIELWKLYNQLEKINNNGDFKIASYLELLHLGYKGSFFGGKCPVDDVIKYVK